MGLKSKSYKRPSREDRGDDAKRRVVVLTCRGRVGRVLAGRLLRAGFLVRGASRSPIHVAPTADPVYFDWSNAATHHRAMKEARKLFLVTPEVEGMVQAVGILLSSLCSDEIDHIVRLSHAGADPASKTPLLADHGVIERDLTAWCTERNVRLTILRPSALLDDVWERRVVDAGSTFTLQTPNDEASPGATPYVTANEVGEAVAAVFADPAQHGSKIYELRGRTASTDEALAAEWNEAIEEKPLKLVPVPTSELEFERDPPLRRKSKIGLLALRQDIKQQTTTQHLDLLLGRPSMTLLGQLLQASDTIVHGSVEDQLDARRKQHNIFLSTDDGVFSVVKQHKGSFHCAEHVYRPGESREKVASLVRSRHAGTILRAVGRSGNERLFKTWTCFQLNLDGLSYKNPIHLDASRGQGLSKKGRVLEVDDDWPHGAPALHRQETKLSRRATLFFSAYAKNVRNIIVVDRGRAYIVTDVERLRSWHFDGDRKIVMEELQNGAILGLFENAGTMSQGDDPYLPPDQRPAWRDAVVVNLDALRRSDSDDAVIQQQQQQMADPDCVVCEEED